MGERAVNRIGVGSGIASVALELAGLLVGVAGGRSTVVPGSSVEAYARAFADPVGPAFWIGAYLELVSFGLFLVFAGWLASVLRRGGEQHAPAAAVALAAGVAYASISLVSLSLGNALGLRTGSRVDPALLAIVQEAAVATYVATWVAAATFSAAASAGLMARSPWLARTGLGLALALLVAVGAASSELAQLPMVLFLVWILAAGIALGRGRHAKVSPTAPAMREASA